MTEITDTQAYEVGYKAGLNDALEIIESQKHTHSCPNGRINGICDNCEIFCQVAARLEIVCGGEKMTKIWNPITQESEPAPINPIETPVDPVPPEETPKEE